MRETLFSDNFMMINIKVNKSFSLVIRVIIKCFFTFPQCQALSFEFVCNRGGGGLQQWSGINQDRNSSRYFHFHCLITFCFSKRQRMARILAMDHFSVSLFKSVTRQINGSVIVSFLIFWNVCILKTMNNIKASHFSSRLIFWLSFLQKGFIILFYWTIL